MPPFRFTAPIAYSYPATRDTADVLLGTVQPGDVRDLAGAPDPNWVPAGPGEDAPAGQAGPQPAPPAVIPPATPAQPSTAGAAGSEE